jgi:VanZ family protein
MSFRRLAIRILATAAAAGWTALIPLLSLLPPSAFAEVSWMEGVPNMDKIVHAILYGAQTLLLIGAWRSFRDGPRVRICIGSALIAAGYGALMEVLQRTLTHTRSFSWGDMAANAVGAALAAGFVLALRPMQARLARIPRRAFRRSRS